MSNSSTSRPLKSLQELYANKQYGPFIDKLLSTKQAFRDGTYHYNLGTAYLKTKQLAASRYHFEKAFKKGLLGPALHKNLETTMNQLEVKSFEQSRYFTDNALNLSLRLPQELSMTISLLLVLLFLGLFRFHKIKKGLLTAGLMISLCLFFFPFLIQQNYQRAILLEAAASYEGPSRSFEVSSDIPEGVSVVVKKNNKSWLYIESPTHFSGWIDRKKLGIL